MASSPITSWKIDGETVETVSDFILGGSKITADGDCSHEIKRHLLLGRKVMTNLDSTLKSRDITLPTRSTWYWRIDAFDLWCWRRLLRVPWTVRRSNQSILKEISPEYSLEGLRLKLKLQYFGYLMWRADSFEKTLMLGKIKVGGEGDDKDEMFGWHHLLNGHGFGWTPGVGDGQGGLVCCGSWDCKELNTTEQLDWTELNWQS